MQIPKREHQFPLLSPLPWQHKYFLDSKLPKKKREEETHEIK